MKVATIFLSTLAIVSGAGIPWVPEPRPEPQWYQRHQRFVEATRNNNGSVHLLFYGDSITEGWNNAGRNVFEEHYAPIGTANYGIAGDKSEHVLWRIMNGEVTDNISPEICVIKIGSNNLDMNDEASIATGITFNVLELIERLPNTKILLLGVLPRNDEAMTRRVSAINDLIRQLDNGNTIKFLDLKDHFSRGGDGEIDFHLVRELYVADLVHLSTAGYRKWAEVMSPVLREMRNSK